MSENHHVSAPAEVAAGTAEAAWNKVREEARALSAGRGIGQLLSAVDEYGVACANRAGAQAVPSEFLRSVIALCTNRGPSPTEIERWSEEDKWIAKLWRDAERILVTTLDTAPAAPMSSAQPRTDLDALHGLLYTAQRQPSFDAMLNALGAARIELSRLRAHKTTPDATPAAPCEYDTLQLYKDLQDLWAEANAVDSVIGRPAVLLAKITRMRDTVGSATAVYLPAPNAQADAPATLELGDYEDKNGEPHPVLLALSEHDDPCEDTADAIARIANLRAEISHLRPFFLRAQAQEEAETERLATQYWQEQAARERSPNV